MHDRGMRIEAKRRIVRQRLRRAKLTLLGASPKAELQPHRLAKQKVKFTGPRNSMKEDKQIANRAARSRVRDAVKRHEEPLPESRNSVRRQYW